MMQEKHTRFDTAKINALIRKCEEKDYAWAKHHLCLGIILDKGGHRIVFKRFHSLEKVARKAGLWLAGAGVLLLFFSLF